MQKLGHWTLEDGPRIVAWWTQDGLGRVVADVPADEAMSTFARVLARYPNGQSRFLNARATLGKLVTDRVLSVGLELGHRVALVLPHQTVDGAGGDTPALVAVEDPRQGLRAPILAGSAGDAQAIARLVEERWPGVRARTLLGERGVRTMSRNAPELAVSESLTALEDVVVAATSGAPWAAALPVVRHRPEGAWLDELLARADALP